ncbi:MAG: hypothetical protein JW857_03875, partial [Bacteroidales bacterium]|nr:hypothetical protein [Bacteroidales bacterium]
MQLPVSLFWNFNKTLYIILFIALLSIGNTFAHHSAPISQEDTLNKLITLEHYIQKTPKSKSKQAEELLKELNLKWYSGHYSNTIKSKITSSAKKMQQNKMSAIPYFAYYISTLDHLLETSNSNESIINWLSAIDYIIEHKNARDFSTFLQASTHFFTKDILFSGPSIKWKIKTDAYTIQFIEDTLKYSFQNSKLSGYSKGDSTTILNTSGIYFPFSNTWKGRKGTLSWARANYDPDRVYAELNQYTIPMHQANFSADSVLFHHPVYFTEPLLGKLDEQVLSVSRNGNNAFFPKFESYEKRIEIK